MKGILGRKIGMTSVFAKNGKLIPVTVIEVEPNIVSQIKTKEKDGYEAIQLAAFDKREKLANKPETGHLKKANTTPKRFLKEIRGVSVSDYALGDVLKADVFAAGEMVDVTGTSKGKGFQGVIKRHNQSRGPMSHGSQYHRGVGSMGTMLPMRVLPGKKLPGHMGHVQVTIQNLEVVKVDLENNVILIKGNVPGPKNSFVIIKTSVKNPEQKNEPADLITYEAVQKTVDEALTEALIKLETTSDQIEYEVLEKESTGLLGLFSKPARIRVCKKEDVQDIVKDFLKRLFENMHLNVEVDMKYDEEEKVIYIDLKGDEMGLLIGKRGQTLDSIQYLTSLVANKNREEYIKIKMVTENYRERRKVTIENLAKNIAIKVKKTRRPATLEPMNPYERRLIHAALQNDKYVETYSEGEEPFRKVVVNISKEYASMPPRRNNNYRKKNGYNGNGGRKPYNKSYGKKPYGKSSYNKPYNNKSYNRNNSYRNQSNFGSDDNADKTED